MIILKEQSGVVSLPNIDLEKVVQGITDYDTHGSEDSNHDFGAVHLSSVFCLPVFQVLVSDPRRHGYVFQNLHNAQESLRDKRFKRLSWKLVG
jgi:hypothetical protein